MQKSEDSGRKGRLNTKTFAVKDGKGNIYVTIPVLLYKKGDQGYDEVNRYFTGMTTDNAVTLSADWCDIQPLNSSTNDGATDDDDK